MWDRWEKGDSMTSIARLFDREHSSVFGQLFSGGITGPHGADGEKCIEVQINIPYNKQCF